MSSPKYQHKKQEPFEALVKEGIMSISKMITY